MMEETRKRAIKILPVTALLILVFFLGVLFGEHDRLPKFSQYSNNDIVLPESNDFKVFFEVWELLEKKICFW